jgi:hypothetical protein
MFTAWLKYKTPLLPTVLRHWAFCLLLYFLRLKNKEVGTHKRSHRKDVASLEGITSDFYISP